MARNAEDSTAAAGAETQTQGTTSTEGSTGGERARVLLTVDAEAAGASNGKFTEGQTGVPRNEFCVALFFDGNDSVKGKRGEIAKHLTRLEGRKVPYQIVFQATKKEVEKRKAAGQPVPEEKAAEEAAAE